MKFAALARDRWSLGRAERGLELGDPFEGDPVHEFTEEILDAANYLNVMIDQGIISEQVGYEARKQIYNLWTMAMTAGSG